MALPYQRRRALGTWVLSSRLSVLFLPGKQHTRFKVNWPIPRLLEAITWIFRLRNRPGICREASDVDTRGQRGCMTSGVRGQGGLQGTLPWCWQSGPTKPGQHLHATEASTFCLTWYTGLWATRYLQEDGWLSDSRVSRHRAWTNSPPCCTPTHMTFTFWQSGAPCGHGCCEWTRNFSVLQAATKVTSLDFW